jgi:hypothetical protein
MNITYAELMKEVDKIEGRSEQYRVTLTEQQIKFIKKARSKNPPLSWRQILDLWNKSGWQKYRNEETLRRRFNDL